MMQIKTELHTYAMEQIYNKDNTKELFSKKVNDFINSSAVQKKIDRKEQLTEREINKQFKENK